MIDLLKKRMIENIFKPVDYSGSQGAFWFDWENK
jgi:hypothetical protein